MPPIPRPTNKILSELPTKEWEELFPKLEEVPLTFGEHLHRADEPIQYLHFPESGIISLISKADDSALVEVGMLGSEGVDGFPIALGVESSMTIGAVQHTGVAYRLRTPDFVEAYDPASLLHWGILRFVHSLMTQTVFAAVCNAHHPANQRLARWLLMLHDRIRSHEFQITQEFLSHMLGVRREAVNKALRELGKTGVIEVTRAQISILDRTGLEGLACSCYARIEKAYRL